MTEQLTDTFASTSAKADLIERIDRAWASLERTLANSDEEALTTPGGDDWSIKDHLAHIEGWERYLLAVLERRSPSTAIGIDLATIRSTNDDALNELVREPTKAQPLSQVLADLRQTHEQLLAVVAALPEDDLERLATHYQPEELAGDTDSIAVWIAHICDEHLQDHVAWIQSLTTASSRPPALDQTLFMLPILPGKTEAARAFLQALDGPRKQELAACGESVGIAKEVWAIQQTPQGDFFVAYMAGENIARAFALVAASQSAFDRWFKQQVQETTGADLNTPPPGPISEILADTAC